MTTTLGKAGLRSELLRQRSAIDAASRTRAARGLADLGPGLVREFAAPHPPVVSAYHPMRGEADPLPLLAALSAADVATALPVMVARAHPLRFLSWRPGEPLRPARFGVLEPPPDAVEREPDLLFIPLAAFDARGFRLGYGGGFYDATLAGLRRRKRILAVGVAFALQEVDRVPSEPHDERLDAVVTEYGLRMFGTG